MKVIRIHRNIPVWKLLWKQYGIFTLLGSNHEILTKSFTKTVTTLNGGKINTLPHAYYLLLILVKILLLKFFPYQTWFRDRLIDVIKYNESIHRQTSKLTRKIIEKKTPHNCNWTRTFEILNLLFVISIIFSPFSPCNYDTILCHTVNIVRCYR